MADLIDLSELQERVILVAVSTAEEEDGIAVRAYVPAELFGRLFSD